MEVGEHATALAWKYHSSTTQTSAFKKKERKHDFRLKTMCRDKHFCNPKENTAATKRASFVKGGALRGNFKRIFQYQ